MANWHGRRGVEAWSGTARVCWRWLFSRCGRAEKKVFVSLERIAEWNGWVGAGGGMSVPSRPRRRRGRNRVGGAGPCRFLPEWQLRRGRWGGLGLGDGGVGVGVGFAVFTVATDALALDWVAAAMVVGSIILGTLLG